VTVSLPPRICLSILLPSAFAAAIQSVRWWSRSRQETVRHPPDALGLGELRRDLVQLADRAAHVVKPDGGLRSQASRPFWKSARCFCTKAGIVFRAVVSSAGGAAASS
jgi:hypothetical protein